MRTEANLLGFQQNHSAAQDDDKKEHRAALQAMDEEIKAGSQIHPEHSPNSEAQAVLGDQQEKEFLHELAAHKVHKRSALRCSGKLRVQDASPDSILQVKQEDMPEAQAAPLAELEKQLGTGHG